MDERYDDRSGTVTVRYVLNKNSLFVLTQRPVMIALPSQAFFCYLAIFLQVNVKSSRLMVFVGYQ